MIHSRCVASPDPGRAPGSRAPPAGLTRGRRGGGGARLESAPGFAGVSRHVCISPTHLLKRGHTLNDSRKTPATQHGNRDPRTARDRRTARRCARVTGRVRGRSGGALGGPGPEAARTVAALTHDADLALGTLLHRVRRAGACARPAGRRALCGRQHAGRDRTRAPRRASSACRLDRGPGPERATGGDPAQNAAGRGRRSAPGGGASGQQLVELRDARTLSPPQRLRLATESARYSRRWPIAWVTWRAENGIGGSVVSLPRAGGLSPHRARLVRAPSGS